MKTILALGRQINGYEINKQISIKLGSPITYKTIKHANKSLIIYWYNNTIFNNELYVTLKDVVLINMNDMTPKYVLKDIVYQKVKRTPKVQLTILPELSTKFQVLTKNNFTYADTSRNDLMDDVYKFIKFLNEMKKLEKKLRKKRLKI